MAKKETEKAKSKIVVAVGKRKDAKARATITAGSGRVTVNSVPLNVWGNEMFRMRVKEPLMLAGELVKKVNIDVNVRSGGTSGQAEAARMAIARGLLDFSKSEPLRKIFIEYDRNLLVFDPRRNEPHKPSRSRAGPRRHKQRSKR